MRLLLHSQKIEMNENGNYILDGNIWDLPFVCTLSEGIGSLGRRCNGGILCVLV